MKLVDYRKALSPKVSQEALAKLVGINSRSVICEIERGHRSAPLKVALKIERWSGGKVPAASICPDAADLRAA